jgi:thiol-disulfide isomerase/thioredoxin
MSNAIERQLAPAPARGADHTTHGLPVGAPAPPLAVADHPVGLDDARAAGRPVVLVFIDPDCGPCHALLPDLESWRRRHADALSIVVLDRQRDVARRYRVHATPTAITVAADGTIASPPALGASAIAKLVAHTAGPPAADEHPGIPLPPPVMKPATTPPRHAGVPPSGPTAWLDIGTGVHRRLGLALADGSVTPGVGAPAAPSAPNAPTPRTP